MERYILRALPVRCRLILPRTSFQETGVSPSLWRTVAADLPATNCSVSRIYPWLRMQCDLRCGAAVCVSRVSWRDGNCSVRESQGRGTVESHRLYSSPLLKSLFSRIASPVKSTGIISMNPWCPAASRPQNAIRGLPDHAPYARPDSNDTNRAIIYSQNAHLCKEPRGQPPKSSLKAERVWKPNTDPIERERVRSRAFTSSPRQS